MLRPAAMELLCAVILDADRDRITDMLIRCDAVHLVRMRDLENWSRGLAAFRTDTSLGKINDLQERIRVLLRSFGVDAIAPEVNVAGFSMNDGVRVSRRLAIVEERLLARRKQLEAQLKRLNEQQALLRQLDLLGPDDIGRLSQARYTFLDVVLARADDRQRAMLSQALSVIPHVLLPFVTRANDPMVLVFSLKTDVAAVGKALTGAGVKPVTLPETAAAAGLEDARTVIRRTIAAAEKDVGVLNARARRDAARLVPVLRSLYSRVFVRAVTETAQSYFERTEKTCLIAGWLPRARFDEVKRRVTEIAGDRCYIHGMRPENVTGVRERREQVPVLLENPRWLRPFEMLVTMYGVPAYDAVDPTLFVACSFLCMFGAMFGDVGQGLVLALFGMVLAARTRGLRAKVGALVAYCGFSATVFGALYGSVFGLDGVLRPLWMRPMDNVAVFFVLAIGMGVMVISVGIVLNIVNAVSARDIVKGLFGKTGLIGGVIYWTVIVIVIRYCVSGHHAVPGGPVALFVGSLAGVFFLKAPVEYLIQKHRPVFPQGLVAYVLETVIDVLETGMGYVANTVSYIRLAAFALAHAGLFLAVFSLANAVRDAGAGSGGPIAIIILGNILIIVLEGMIAAIQGLRLEYYEFFSKFFTDGGKMYRPIGFGTSM